MRVQCLSLFLALSTAAVADPPTPPEKPRLWEFVGSYQGGGPERVNVVVAPESIHRDGDIISVYVGTDFIKVNGFWQPDLGWIIDSYKLDCKFHTFNRLWYENSNGFQNDLDRWLTIEPGTTVAMAAKKLCASPGPN